MRNIVATGGDSLYLFKFKMFEVRFYAGLFRTIVGPVRHMHLFVLIAAPN